MEKMEIVGEIKHEKSGKRVVVTEEQLPEPDQIRIGNELHELFWNAYYNRDNSTCQVSKDNMCFIDRFGIVWFVKRRDVRWFCYDLFAYSDGKVIDANYCER